LIETEEKHIPYQASILFGGLIEWACILNEEEIYDKIVSCIKKCFPEITPQSWHLNIDEEDIFYKKNAVYLSGSGFIVDKNKAIGDQLEILKTTYFSDNIDDFSFNKYCFSSIATITNRYYRAPVLIYAWRRFLNIDDGQD